MNSNNPLQMNGSNSYSRTSTILCHIIILRPTQPIKVFPPSSTNLNMNGLARHMGIHQIGKNWEEGINVLGKYLDLEAPRNGRQNMFKIWFICSAKTRETFRQKIDASNDFIPHFLPILLQMEHRMEPKFGMPDNLNLHFSTIIELILRIKEIGQNWPAIRLGDITKGRWNFGI